MDAAAFDYIPPAALPVVPVFIPRENGHAVVQEPVMQVVFSDWAKMKMPALKDAAKERKIKKWSEMKKGELVAALSLHDQRKNDPARRQEAEDNEDGGKDAEAKAAPRWNADLSARLIHVILDRDLRDMFCKKDNSANRAELDSRNLPWKQYWNAAAVLFNDNTVCYTTFFLILLAFVLVFPLTPVAMCSISSAVDQQFVPVHLDPTDVRISLLDPNGGDIETTPWSSDKLQDVYKKTLRSEWDDKYEGNFKLSGHHNPEFWDYCHGNAVLFYMYLAFKDEEDILSNFSTPFIVGDDMEESSCSKAKNKSGNKNKNKSNGEDSPSSGESSVSVVASAIQAFGAAREATAKRRLEVSQIAAQAKAKKRKAELQKLLVSEIISTSKSIREAQEEKDEALVDVLEEHLIDLRSQLAESREAKKKKIVEVVHVDSGSSDEEL